MVIYYKSLLSKKIRYLLGLITLAVIGTLYFLFGDPGWSQPELIRVIVIIILTWLITTGLTDKYSHKYPNRYASYAFSANLKAFLPALLILILLLLFRLVDGALFRSIFLITALFYGVDFLLFLPRRKMEQPDLEALTDAFYSRTNGLKGDRKEEGTGAVAVDLARLEEDYLGDLPWAAKEMVCESLTDDKSKSDRVALIGDLEDLQAEPGQEENMGLGLLLCRTSLNRVRRLNNLLKAAAGSLKMGGLLVVSYRPLEVELKRLKEQASPVSYPFRYLAHFTWYRALPKLPWIANIYFSPPFAWIDGLRRKVDQGPRRVLAKAEVWGRLVYYGLEIVGEESSGDQAYVLARKVSPPSSNKEPTFHPVVTLEKVGLEGRLIRTHKVRSMYAFSEFLQKDVFEKHGLTNTGKFKDDFRLTDYGPFIRKYWIDEIPGIYDWLRGDIKLVGLRATSPQYLSLYPRDFFKLYIQVKPGLIPPIFDEETTGFEQIVEIERTYLERYLENPWRTDLSYLWYTIRDIFVRRVRSK
jgi:lipopolysaccharide/colanic/teichoic acid biosynthesis glycosyltransferase